MSPKTFFLLTAVLAELCLPAEAALYPASQPGLIAKSTAVVDERGRKWDLFQMILGSRPVLLLPIFTKCRGSCPVMAESLRTAFQKRPDAAPFRVAIYSFDATDTAADLAAFRKEQQLPLDWMLVRPRDAAGARAFLDQFSYSFMNTNVGYVHPNELFVFSAQGRWSGILTGEDFPPKILSAAYRDALDLDQRTLHSRIGRLLAHPENWAVFAASGIVLGSLAALGLSFKRL